MKPIYGWWFSESKKLPYGDERRVQIGRTHKVKPPINLCRWGLHLSINALDALVYAKGTIVWRVKAGGEIVRDDNKLVCSERTYIAGGTNVTDTLERFAQLCALDVVHLWDAPKVLVQYLRTGNKVLQKDALDVIDSPTWVTYPTTAEEVAKDAAWEAIKFRKVFFSPMESRKMRWEVVRAAGITAMTAQKAVELFVDDGVEVYKAYTKQNRRLTRMLREAIRKSC